MLKKNILGKSGLEVTELCFGTLPMGKLQTNLGIEEGARLAAEAIESGINFFDGAQLYGNYEYLRRAMQLTGRRDIVISSKSVHTDYQGMEAAIQEALTAMERDYLDIFFLHAPRSGADLFEEWAGAWQCLQDYKQKGYLRSIGVACHKPVAALAAAGNEDVDIIFPLINKAGWGYVDGSTVEQMLAAIEKGRQANKGMYAMKVFAGGHLVGEMNEAVEFVRRIPGIQSLAIGMVNSRELSVQLRIFNGETIPQDELEGCKRTKELWVMPFCIGCGNCVKTCSSGGIKLVEGKAQVVAENCLLCGYCVPSCPAFAIRMR